MRSHFGPSPMVPVWHNPETREFIQESEFIPVVSGLALAAAYDIAGLAVIAFAPPPFKPIGVAMVAPGPSEAILFGVGYVAGTWFRDSVIGEMPLKQPWEE